MENYSAFVGGVSGVFKGFKASLEKGVHNITNLQRLKEITQRNEVTVLSWADKLETEVLVGYSNQSVKIFDLNQNTFTHNEEMVAGEGPIRGLFRLNGSLVTAVESGVVKVWGDTETLIETGGPMSRMRQSPDDEHVIGTGGKENDLKLWDLQTGTTTFVAKNVRHDELELRVPVWVMDLAFVPNSRQVAVATRYGHARLYDPSTPTRRPVCQVEAKDISFTCIATTPQEHQFVLGCTTGNMYLVDLRGKGLLLNKYRGFMGSVRQVACPAAEPYIVSVSLDRHLRVHHLHSKKLLVKEYMQSRLSALLLKSSFTMQDIKEEKKEESEENNTNDVDEEYEQMFEKMEVVTDKTPAKTKRLKLVKKTNMDDSEEESETSEKLARKHQSSDKRQKTNEKHKTKRLKKQDSEIIVVN